MKPTSWLIIAAVALVSCQETAHNATETLQQVVEAISKKQQFEYKAIYQIQSLNEVQYDTAQVVLERISAEVKLPLQYVFETNRGELQFFNGTTLSNVLPTERIILEATNPPDFLMNSNQGLLFSPIFIERYVAYLLEHQPKAIQYLGDTLVNQQPALSYLLETNFLYTLTGEVIQNGDVLPNQMQAENLQQKHKLVISKNTNMPLVFQQINSSTQSIGVQFIETNQGATYAIKAQELTNTQYLKLSFEEYSGIQQVKQRNLMGQPMQNFSLPQFESTPFNLSDKAGKPVLIEYWFPGCGFCIQAAPQLNELYTNYRSKGLEAVAIEFSDASNTQISKYIAQHQVALPVLTEGKRLAVEYGVVGGPTFMVLDKNHNIVYFESGFHQEALEAVIQQVL